MKNTSSGKDVNPNGVIRIEVSFLPDPSLLGSWTAVHLSYLVQIPFTSNSAVR